MKLAAIDIGSNAVRLMLSRVYDADGEPTFIKESLIRVPLRLGEDVFAHKHITAAKVESLATVMTAFRLLIEAYGAEYSIACATSAMREARNGKEIVRDIKKRCGVHIELIEGKREAAIIYSSHIGSSFRLNSSLLFADVGGGSTEITLLSRNRILQSASFKIGTVRTLQKGKSKREHDRLKSWLRTQVAPLKPVAAVGTGGSINNIFRLSRKKEGKPLGFRLIRDIREYLDSFTVEERIKVLGLRPDRADVIVVAADIYLSILKWAGVKRMYVPVMGLSDGLINVLYEKVKSEHVDL